MGVRLAARPDLPEILALERETASAPHWAEAAYAAMVANEQASESLASGVLRALFVADEDGVLAGFCAATVAAGVGELESVVVRASARRRGWGRELCRAAMLWARGAGAEDMELEVRAESAGAIALYRELGFVEQGRRSGYYREPAEDALLMRCQAAGVRQTVTGGEV